MSSSINLMVVAGSHHNEHNIHLFVMHAHYQTQNTISQAHTSVLKRKPNQTSHAQGHTQTQTLVLASIRMQSLPCISITHTHINRWALHSYQVQTSQFKCEQVVW